jgi:hypothetical protein
MTASQGFEYITAHPSTNDFRRKLPPQGHYLLTSSSKKAYPFLASLVFIKYRDHLSNNPSGRLDEVCMCGTVRWLLADGVMK